MTLPRPHRLICTGFRRWKQHNLTPILRTQAGKLEFVPNVRAASHLHPSPSDALCWWGCEPPAGLVELAQTCGAMTIRIEDGFIRSVGLGSDLIPPMSLVLDRTGIYFDPGTPSDLEHILLATEFTADELAAARTIRDYIVQHGLTKYNLEPRRNPEWPSAGRKVVLVTGQVEDDASIRFGCSDVKTNLELLHSARADNPSAFIVYKPHPDVMSGNRRGNMALAAAHMVADHIETRLSVISCIEAADEVHVMTSLSGFDALLRGKRVITYGQPFYAGWGLTDDRARDGVALARRQRRLTLDEMVAGALIFYPIYWDPTMRELTDCGAVLRKIATARDALEQSSGLERLRSGLLRRQLRKAGTLVRALISPSG